MADGASERRRPAQRPSAPPKWRVEGQPDEAPGRRFRPRGRFLALMAGLLLLNWVVGQSVLSTPDRLTVSYDEFITQLEAGNVKELNTQNDRGEGTFKEAVTVDKKTDDAFKVILPRYSLNGNTLEDRLFDKKVRQNAKSVDQPPPVWQQILVGFGPTLLLIGIIVWFWRRASSMGGGMLSGLGRSKAKRYDAAGEGRATFEDVAGIDEAEQELVEVVDFLKQSRQVPQSSARRSRAGVLLSGLPGTGKTLLARAVAGEADVPFFSLSASEFVEMIVGVGASRVRDLFAQAKAAAPAIIFIDELDAIGRARGSGDGLRRQRRARADPQPDPHRDGRLLGHARASSSWRRRTAPRSSTRRSCGPGASTVASPSTRPTRSAASRSSTCTPAACRSPRMSTWHRSPQLHAGHGRRRPQEPRQRGRAHGGTARPRAGPTRRLHRLAREDRPRRRAQDRPLARPTASAPPTTSRATRSSGCCSPGPTPCARSRSSRGARARA